MVETTLPESCTDATFGLLKTQKHSYHHSSEPESKKKDSRTETDCRKMSAENGGWSFTICQPSQWAGGQSLCLADDKYVSSNMRT